MKLEFKFDNVQTLNVFNTFEIREMFQAPCCRMQICGKILVLWLQCTAKSRLLPESANKLFSTIQLPITTKLQLLNVQQNFCSVTCYTVLIEILNYWLYTDISKQHTVRSINWHKPVYCIQSDKINLIKRHSHSYSTNFGNWFAFNKCNEWKFWTA